MEINETYKNVPISDGSGFLIIKLLIFCKLCAIYFGSHLEIKFAILIEQAFENKQYKSQERCENRA